MEKKMPKATAKRLPVYLRYLKMLGDSGVKRIKSREFSEMIQIPSATIRRDFSHVGELGRSGYGYDVPYLIEVFSNILNTQEEKRIALIGCGNLGKALLKNNLALVGTTINGLLVHDMSELEAFVRQEGVTVAISTVPSHHAQKAIDKIVQAGVTAILNFAPDRVSVPANVSVQYIDLTTELQTLIYFNETFSLANSPKQ